MKQHIDLQQGNECFFFIANYHSLTTVQDPELLRKYTHDVALDYLALGLDPTKVNMFRQTDVPEVTELTWILSTVTGTGLLERATSYKDKVAKNIMPSMGLFCYPILMAADILIYRSDVVPVGKDQLQHIEMTQDMATYFNTTFKCEVLKRPEPMLGEAPIVPGIDGQKMSKSYGNTVPPPVEAPKDPDTCNVFALYRLMATPDETAALRKRYLAGGMGYGEAKKALAEVVERTLGPARERREKLERDADFVEDVLLTAGRRARAVARGVMDDVRRACGLVAGKETHL
jgi:tryptophanyl-tRNA synthetase